MSDLDTGTKVEAVEHLQEAICALIEDDYGAYSERLGSACRLINNAAGVPYHLEDAGGLPVEEIGPSISAPAGHSVWLTLPEGREHEMEQDFSVNFYDHLHVVFNGERKGEPVVTIRSDEFPTELRIDDVENSFTAVEHVDGGEQ